MNRKNLIFYFGILLFSVLFLYVGNKIAVTNLAIFGDDADILTAEAKVIKIIDISENNLEFGEVLADDKEITFEAAVKEGFSKKSVTAMQSISSYYFSNAKEVEEGDKVIITSFSDGEEWYFVDYVRIDKILVLSIVFIVLLLLFGKMKGLNALLSLGLTCVSIFAIFIPSLLSGKNIYVASIVICIYSIAVTLLIVNGVNRKSLAAIIGCVGGVAATGILTLIMSKALGLTGMINDESMHLLLLPTEKPIDLKAIIFAGIIIGAVGAVMDVAMSISTALWELKTQVRKFTFNRIVKSGINIGKDIMGTMTNTLILAYIGNSLSVVLLLIVYSNSLAELMNKELVIVELLQAVVGSLGILLTMPLTTVACAVLYSKKPR